jgi:hypothetical protein
MAFKKFYNIQKFSSCSEQAVTLHYSDYHLVLHGLANDKKETNYYKKNEKLENTAKV